MASVAKRKWKSPNVEEKQGWEVRYKHNGKHCSRTFKTKKEADLHKRKVENEIEGGTHVARREGATVRCVADDFLKHQEDRMRDGRMGRSSLENYNSAIRNHIVPHLGARRLDEITALDVEQWFRLLTREGKAAAGFGTAVVLNPEDWAAIELLKDTQGAYLHAAVTTGAEPRLWGMRVVESDALPVGSFMVGAFALAAKIWDREVANVQISSEDRDNFVRNMLTLRGEERLALTVTRPSAFVGGAFPAPTP